MTVMMNDAYEQVKHRFGDDLHRHCLDHFPHKDLIYADDTLLIGVSDAHVNEYLHAVFKAGQKYGMELHVKISNTPTMC